MQINKIDYIVFGNPRGVRKLIHSHGYNAPKDKTTLSATTKALVREKGKPIIKQLIDLHPDKKAILKTAPKTCNCQKNESNFCGCNSSYVGEEEDLPDITKMSLDELKQHYQLMVKKANANPENTRLSDEVQRIWKKLISEFQQTETEKSTTLTQHIKRTNYLMIGGLLLFGFVLGKSL